MPRRIPRTAILNKEVNVERLKLHNRSDVSKAGGDRDEDYSGRSSGYVHRDYSQESILSSAAQAKNRAASVTSIDNHSRQPSANFGTCFESMISINLQPLKRLDDRQPQSSKLKHYTTLKPRVLTSCLVLPHTLSTLFLTQSQFGKEILLIS